MFTCELCKKEFTSLRALCGHKAFCGKNIEKTCPICQKKLTHYNYSDHVNSHNKDKQCLNCGKLMRFKIKFCSQSCAAIYNNKNRKKPKFCIYCGNQIMKRNAGKYCSLVCQQKYHRKQYIEKWLKGEEIGGKEHYSHYIKNWLLEQNNNRCMNPNCGWDWTKPCTIEIEHKDGNYLNNRPENLMLICPNCHSQTLTYKGKNKGHGRAKRLQRYREGKSY